MNLEITFTPEGLTARTCEGRVEYSLRSRGGKVSTVRLNAVEMRVLAVELPGEQQAPQFAYDDKVLTVQLPKPISREETVKLAVKYRLEDPVKGMHFVLPNASEPNKPVMVYTMSEPIEARYWLPSHDWPNARWTSDTLITVPAPYTAVSNGVLIEKKPSADGKGNTFHWRNDIPTDPHLVGLALGELVELRDEWRRKPVVTFTQRGSEAAAKFTFRHVPEMLELFSNLTGVDFPYPAYTHVTVVDHHHGGMEHAGLSFVRPLFIAATDDGDWPLEQTESWLISHMLAHQWFGGIVNYRSVSQAWLNEGFASYLDTRWTSHNELPARFEYEMWQHARSIARFDTSESGKPMINRDLADLMDIYQSDGGKIYSKGAWVLHMLHHQIGGELFWRGVGNYLRGHQWQGVETGDLRRALEEISGRDLEQFFQQWVYGHGVPRLEVDYDWNVAHKKARVIVRQTQKVDAITPAFAFPLDLYFRVGREHQHLTVQVTDARHEFTYTFPAEPKMFCVDPNGGLLKTLSVNLPRALLLEQARHGPTALSRLLAVDALDKDSRPDAILALEDIIRNESEFWGVRSLAAEGLGRIQTEEAAGALLRAEQAGRTNARVLSAVVEALGKYIVSRSAHETVLKLADHAQPLQVEAAAVAALGQMRAAPELVTRSARVLEAAAAKPTRAWVRFAAFQALRHLDESSTFDTVFDLAQPGRLDDLRGMAIPLLGTLGRHDDLRTRARDTLTKWLHDADRTAQAAAMNGLGHLGDPRAIANLERLRSGARSESLRKAAGQAIEAIKKPDDPKQATSALIERLGAIEKQNQEFERKIKTLTEKLQALEGRPKGKSRSSAEGKTKK